MGTVEYVKQLTGKPRKNDELILKGVVDSTNQIHVRFDCTESKDDEIIYKGIKSLQIYKRRDLFVDNCGNYYMAIGIQVATKLLTAYPNAARVAIPIEYALYRK